MAASVIAIADEVAAAADLVRKKTSGEPAVRVRGLEELLIEEKGAGPPRSSGRPKTTSSGKRPCPAIDVPIRLRRTVAA